MIVEGRVEAILRPRGFRAEVGRGDFANDAGVVVEAKSRIGGVRDLHAAIMQLASYASEPAVREGWLIVGDHRLPESIAEAWGSALGLLRPTVAKKLRLIAVSGDVVISVPDDAQLLEIGRELARTDTRNRPSKSYDAYFEVLHVLLVRWLLNQGPIQVGELGTTAGLSQPTVRAALRRLGAELRKDSRRRVELASFPRRAWQEMVALGPRIRDSQYFTDESGKPRSAEKLLERLRRNAPPNVAVGGVFAARHWDPEFDLEGVPRLDLCVHGPGSALSFLDRMDPALRSTDGRSGVSLAVHRVRRRLPLYEVSPRQKIPWADPVETLLDLEELRLHVQADEMVRRLRAESR